MATTGKTVLRVEGMSCGNCVHHVEEALRGVEGVSGVEVSLKEGKAAVEHSGGASVAALIAAIEEAGYEASATN